MRLVELHPDSLRVQDPLSGLYPFMLVSSFRNHMQQPPCRILPFPGTNSCSNEVENNDDCNHIQENHTDWKKDHVRMSFFLLSLCPEAIQYQGDGPTAGENKLIQKTCCK